MNELGAEPTSRRRHLHTPEELAAHPASDKQDLTRQRAQGNGLRVHSLYFVIVSLIALVFLVAAIAIATADM